ncbi:MAG TPA: hypothetical protein VFE60_00325 [Roseiarcus sp.]|jgi:hypothetical protein|nr:hypothetical protein [Roseiarcus sp.]
MPYSTNDGWVGDVYLPNEQKAALLAFIEAIGAKRRLGKDEAGNPRIEGRRGRVYVQPSSCQPGRQPKFQLVFNPGHPFGWQFARDALKAFAKVTNNGSGEGILLMERLPTAGEGEIIRRKLVIFKRVEYSEEALSARRAHMARLHAIAREAKLNGAGTQKTSIRSRVAKTEME